MITLPLSPSAGNSTSEKLLASPSSSQKTAPLLSRQELFWVAGLILVSLLLLAGRHWFFLPSQKPIACLYAGSELVEILDLSNEPARIFQVKELPTVYFECDGKGGIRFYESDCPDQICVHTGFLRKVGDWAACVPNRALIRIRGSEDESTGFNDSEGVDFIAGPGGFSETNDGTENRKPPITPEPRDATRP